jgi:hypothetical protein
VHECRIRRTELLDSAEIHSHHRIVQRWPHKNTITL